MPVLSFCCAPSPFSGCLNGIGEGVPAFSLKSAGMSKAEQVRAAACSLLHRGADGEKIV